MRERLVWWRRLYDEAHARGQIPIEHRVAKDIFHVHAFIIIL